MAARQALRNEPARLQAASRQRPASTLEICRHRGVRSRVFQTALPAWLVADLRANHAGETGAVALYRGILAVTRDPEVAAMARHRVATKQMHLDVITRLLPAVGQSLLLPLWRVAGWLTGVLPTLMGPRAVYVTTEAVEQFVHEHYRRQVRQLEAMPHFAAIRERLVVCWQDETAQQDETAALTGQRRSGLARLWRRLVGRGSAIAVALARRL